MTLGPIERFNKLQGNSQHCLHPLAYTCSELHFQRYHSEPNDPKELKYNLHYGEVRGDVLQSC